MAKDGQTDKNGMKLCLETVWSRAPRWTPGEKSALLVCDQFRSRVMGAMKRMVTELNIQLAVFSGGHTSHLQPLDVSINRLFKAFIREEWTKWTETPNHDLTPTG
jgi:hypothetical protein